jgi:hypothetical protein
METLLTASEADWALALAKRRERVLSKLAASKECSRAMIDKACVKLQFVPGDGVSASGQI